MHEWINKHLYLGSAAQVAWVQHQRAQYGHREQQLQLRLEQRRRRKRQRLQLRMERHNQLVRGHILNG